MLWVLCCFLVACSSTTERVNPPESEPDRIEGVVPGGIPVVRIGTTVVDDPGYDTVHADDERGAYAATKRT